MRPTRPVNVGATVFEQRDVVVDGLRLRYIDEGAREGPAVLLMPGHTSRIEEYDALVPALTSTHRVLVFDFPGSGYSDKPEREYDLVFYEDVAIGFLDAVGVGPADLAGGSLGGNLTLRLGRRFPDRFRRLVSWAPGSIWKRKRFVAWFGQLIAGYQSFKVVSKIQSRFWYSDDFPERERLLSETFRYYDEVMCPGFVDMYWGLANSQADFSLRDIAADIPQNVLLLWGDEDSTPEMAEGICFLGRTLPRCEVKAPFNAGHSLAAEEPEALGAAIAEFLRRPGD